MSKDLYSAWELQCIAARNEERRVALSRWERELDGALFFDADDKKVRSLALRIRHTWQQDDQVPPEQFEKMCAMMKLICIHADWDKWPMIEQPTWTYILERTFFSPNDVADVAVERTKKNKQHAYLTYLSAHITHGNFELARHIYLKGDKTWCEFALLHLGNGINACRAQDSKLYDAKWAERTRRFVTHIAYTVSPATAIGAKASHIRKTLEPIGPS